MASFSCPSLFSAARTRVRADKGLAGFQESVIAPSTGLSSGCGPEAGRGKRLETGAEANDSTLFLTSADMLEKSEDSLPAIRIPRVMKQFYLQMY
jgi:hypothetical protein